MKKKKSTIVTVKYGDKKIKLSRGYVKAVKDLMREEILMMRKVPGNSPESWQIGVAEIKNIGNADYLSMMFGVKEDLGWMKRQGQIFVKVS